MSDSSTDWHASVYAGGHACGYRRPPPKAIREQLLREQQNRCFWCSNEFGTFVSRGAKRVPVQVAWDHVLPFAYIQRNPDRNWVASCRTCNLIKRDLVFDTVVKCQDFIRHQRFIKGYR